MPFSLIMPSASLLLNGSHLQSAMSVVPARDHPCVKVRYLAFQYFPCVYIIMHLWHLRYKGYYSMRAKAHLTGPKNLSHTFTSASLHPHTCHTTPTHIREHSDGSKNVGDKPLVLRRPFTVLGVALRMPRLFHPASRRLQEASLAPFKPP